MDGYLRRGLQNLVRGGENVGRQVASSIMKTVTGRTDYPPEDFDPVFVMQVRGNG